MEPASACTPACTKCGATFGSRNQLFKHLRESTCGKGLAANAKDRTEKVCLLYGYSAIPYACDISNNSSTLAISSQTPDVVECVTKSVSDSLLRAFDYARGVKSTGESDPSPTVDRRPISSDNPTLRSYTDYGHAPGFSCASHTQFRCKQFRQGDLSASCDVMSLKLETLTQPALVKEFVSKMNDKLPPNIRVFRRQKVDMEFHAERHCDRRRYECLLPLQTLLPADKSHTHDVLLPELLPILQQFMQQRQRVQLQQKKERWLQQQQQKQQNQEARPNKPRKRQKIKSTNEGDSRKREQQPVNLKRPVKKKNRKDGSPCVLHSSDEPEQHKNKKSRQPMDVETSREKERPAKKRQQGWEESEEQARVAARSANMNHHYHHGLVLSQNEKLRLFRKLKRVLKRFSGKHHFHNFSPGLYASEPTALRQVYRCFTKAPHLVLPVGTNAISNENNEEPQTHQGTDELSDFVLVSITGQSFLYEQVQRILGLLVAIMREHLPEEIIPLALDPEIVLEMPCLPPHCVLLGECSYFEYETKGAGATNAQRKGNKPDKTGRQVIHRKPNIEYSIFPNGWKGGHEPRKSSQPETKKEEEGNDEKDLKRMALFYDELLCSIARYDANGRNTDSFGTGSASPLRPPSLVMNWLNESVVPTLPSVLAKACRQAISTMKTKHAITGSSEPSLAPSVHATPRHYVRVLRLLREAEASGMWPTSSQARRKLIKGWVESVQSTDNQDKEHHQQAVADKAGAQSFSLGYMPPPLKPPRTNVVFPELLFALFELEQLIGPAGRSLSSTIAVNKHAQFRPHRDNGAGAGQSTSLIVGLGDYTGGCVVVEGEESDVQFHPLEFNGWTQVHWTTPFTGERFSIVWFTPRGGEGKSCLPDLSVGLEGAPSHKGIGLAGLTGFNVGDECVLDQQDISSLPSTPISLRAVWLSNGVKLPMFGFGTFRQKGETCRSSTAFAVAAGYGLVDTAFIYKNHDAVRTAFQDSGTEGHTGPEEAGALRKRVFVTSKIPLCEPDCDAAVELHSDTYAIQQVQARAYQAGLRCLEELGLEYIDLLLIHWPGVMGTAKRDSKIQREDRQVDQRDRATQKRYHRLCRMGTWLGMQQLYEDGYCRAVGVSNYEIRHLEELVEQQMQTQPQGLANSVRVLPHVNQVELHPLNWNSQRSRDLREYCQQHLIQIQGHSLFGGGDHHKTLLQHPTITRLAHTHTDVKVTNEGVHMPANHVAARTSTQVLIGWILSVGLPCVLGSTSFEHIAENIGVDNPNAAADQGYAFCPNSQREKAPRFYYVSPEQLEELHHLCESGDEGANYFAWNPSQVL